jgi:hypothetical protein
MQRKHRYARPELECFGSFRDLTRQSTSGKLVIGDDLVPGIGSDCDPDPSSGQAACLGVPRS